MKQVDGQKPLTEEAIQNFQPSQVRMQSKVPPPYDSTYFSYFAASTSAAFVKIILQLHPLLRF
jgi:hypothetical protein